MNFKYYTGKHVTVITVLNNQPISPEGIAQLFSGFVRGSSRYGGEYFINMELMDGTVGSYNLRHVVGIVENQSMDVEQSSMNVCNEVHSSECVDAKKECGREDH